MSGSRSEQLLSAVLAAQGVEPQGDLAPEMLILARQLVEAYRPVPEAEICPTRARRRAHALLDELPERPWELLARLVFDSWTQLAPAARSVGTDRLLRYENGSTAIDLQVRRESPDGHLALVVAAESCGDVCRARLLLDGGARTLDLDLDEHGTGSTQSIDAEHDVVVVVFDEDGELLRTPAVPFP